MEFDNFEELSLYVKRISEETLSVFTIIDSRTVETANKRIAAGRTKYHTKFKYCYVKFGCKHFGNAKSQSTGIRPNQRTYKTGCTSFIHASVDRKKDKLVIIKSNLKHNHDTSKKLYMCYPEQRRVNNDQKKFIEDLQDLQVPSDVICQHMKDVHGKHLTVRDIQNIQKQRNVASLPCDEKDKQVTSEQPLSLTIIRGGDTLISQTVSYAIQPLEDELESARDSIQANIKAAESQFPKLFYTTSAPEAYQVIQSYEVMTNSKFNEYEESKYFGQNKPLLVMARLNEGKDGSKDKLKHRIVWEDRETSLGKSESIPYDGVPYIQLGRKIYDCHLGVLREKPRKGSSKQNRKIPGSSKVGCTARISLREIHKFPEFKVEKCCDSDKYRSLKSKEIHRAILNRDEIGERRIYVSLPSVADHSGHHVTKVDNFLTDLRVKKKIYELTYQRIFTVEGLREKTKEFVETELFKGKPLLSPFDRRFYPSDVTFQNICYLARLKMGKEGSPVPVPLQHCRSKKQSLPKLTNVPPVAHEVTVVTSPNHTSNSPLVSNSSPPLSPSLSERSDEPSDFFDALEEVKRVALNVADETILEELKQTVVNVRKRLKAHCNEGHSVKRQRLGEDTGDLDKLAEGVQIIAEICN